MASIKLILRKQQLDQSGHCPLYIRVIKDRRTKFISTGVKLKENEWDEQKQRVKKNYPNSARLNASLSQKVADAEAQVADMERKVKSVSAKKLKEAIKGKEIPNFFDYAQKWLEKSKNSISLSTYKFYVVQVRKLENFVGSKDLYFDDFTISFLKDYLEYLANSRKNTATTQRLSIVVLGTIFREAIREEIISETLFPFSKLKLKTNNTKRLFLNKEQIEELVKLDFKKGKKAPLWRDLFLFSIYAGGLRFSDVMELQYAHYNPEEQRITKYIRKTGRVHQFKIGKVAIDILEKYMKDGSKHNDYIFPVITHKKEAYQNSQEVKYTLTARYNQIANRHLKVMGERMKLPFLLSFHLSRHTFATNALNNGMRIEHVSKLMDHRDISTTQVYAKIISEELDKAVDNYIY